MSSILLAGLYRTLTSNQKTYAVQEQVVDMQQNARIAADRMVREIRMAGFGNVSMVLPATFNGKTFNNLLNPDNGSLTFVLANVSVGTLTAQGAIGQNTISFTPDPNGDPDLNTGDRGYISIGGVESHRVTSVVDNGTKTVTLNGTLLHNHPAGTPIFGIRAITYQTVLSDGKPALSRDENLGLGGQLQADNIEGLQFDYFDAGGNPTGNPTNVRIVRLTLTARTERQDPDYKDGDGYRKRQLASNIHLINLGLNE
jgi:hypothetical protein